MEIANLFRGEWDDIEEDEGFQIRGAGIGRKIGADLIGGSVFEVDPGKKVWPYHHHHANEEWLVVRRGRPTLRSPEGEYELSEGDVVCFRRGPEGAHQVRNATDAPLASSCSRRCSCPSSSNTSTAARQAHAAKGQRIFLSRPGPSLDYWDGES